MTNRQIVKHLMDYIREYTKELDEERYKEVLESLWFEIEDERRQCCWGDEYEEDQP